MTTKGFSVDITITDGPSAGEIWDAGKYANRNFLLRFKGYFLVTSEGRLHSKEVVFFVRVAGVAYADTAKPDENLMIDVYDLNYGEGDTPSWVPQHAAARIKFDTHRRNGGLSSSS